MSGGKRGPVAGVVLAAGLSSRMDRRFKLLLPYGDGTVVGAVVEVAVEAGLDPVVVVVGHRAGEVRRALARTGARVVQNPDFRDGMATSLAAGIRALRSEGAVSGAAVLLGDEPGVRAETIRAAVEAWRRGGAPVLRTTYRDRPGHPVLFARAAFPLLEGLRGDRGPAESLEPERLEVALHEVDLPAPVDIDTPGAYRRALAGDGL